MNWTIFLLTIGLAVGACAFIVGEVALLNFLGRKIGTNKAIISAVVVFTLILAICLGLAS